MKFAVTVALPLLVFLRHQVVALPVSDGVVETRDYETVRARVNGGGNAGNNPATANRNAAGGGGGGKNGGGKGGNRNKNPAQPANPKPSPAGGNGGNQKNGVNVANPNPSSSPPAANPSPSPTGIPTPPGNDPLQTSLALDKSQVQPGLANNGQSTAEPGQAPSATSLNNFINFCASQKDVPLTNGQQIKSGSCNPTIMGRIIPTNKFPSSKFTFPENLSKIPANKNFTVTMAITNLVSGLFVNPNTNYYAAPCQVDNNGIVLGHSHFVIQKLQSLTQTTPPDPTVFAFFKGVNTAANNGVLSAAVNGGIAPGVYRLASINACMNHQPILGAVAQRGHFDDMIYFTAE